MKAEQRQKWIDALRSGQYQQSPRALHDDGGFCCLGLLAHVVGGLKPESLEHCGTYGFLSGEATGGDYGLGVPEQEGDRWFDPSQTDTHTTLQRKLAAMNDNGQSFAEIADWIEANVPVES